MIDTLKGVWDDWNEYCKQREKANEEEEKKAKQPKYNFSSGLQWPTTLKKSTASNATGTGPGLKSDRVLVPDVPPAAGSYSYQHGYGDSWFKLDQHSRITPTCPVNKYDEQFNIGDPVKTPNGDGYIYSIDDQGLFIVELGADKDVVYEFNYDELKKDPSREPRKPKERDAGGWIKGSTDAFIGPTHYYGVPHMKFITSDDVKYAVNTGTVTINIEKPVLNKWWFSDDEAKYNGAPIENVGPPTKAEDTPTKEYVGTAYKHRPMPDKHGVCLCSDCISWASD